MKNQFFQIRKCRKSRRLEYAGKTELFERQIQMVLNRFLRDAEYGSNLLVGNKFKSAHYENFSALLRHLLHYAGYFEFFLFGVDELFYELVVGNVHGKFA